MLRACIDSSTGVFDQPLDNVEESGGCGIVERRPAVVVGDFDVRARVLEENGDGEATSIRCLVKRGLSRRRQK